jgi:small subunit ribosomal protein S17
MTEKTEKLQRTLIGKATSVKMDKTVTVLVERKVKHPIIGKVVVKSKKYHAHDENNEVKLGDIVEIQETTPISRTKSWKVSKIVQRAVII